MLSALSLARARVRLQGVAFGTRAMVEAILSVSPEEESPRSHTEGETQGEVNGASPSLSRLTVVGGATRSPIFMQLLADVRRTPNLPVFLSCLHSSLIILGAGAWLYTSGPWQWRGDSCWRGARNTFPSLPEFLIENSSVPVATQGIVAVAGMSVADVTTDSTRRERLAAAIDRISKTWVKLAQSYEPESGRHEEYGFFYKQ